MSSSFTAGWRSSPTAFRLLGQVCGDDSNSKGSSVAPQRSLMVRTIVVLDHRYPSSEVLVEFRASRLAASDAAISSAADVARSLRGSASRSSRIETGSVDRLESNRSTACSHQARPPSMPSSTVETGEPAVVCGACEVLPSESQAPSATTHATRSPATRIERLCSLAMLVGR